MSWSVYLSGEIHSNWRDELIAQTEHAGLDVSFSGPVTDHATSDDCGVAIMGPEEKQFWHDHKGAKLNAIRTRRSIQKADAVVVRFGEKYKQWNAAFDAGFAAALAKPIIVLHDPSLNHALKEVDAAALATVSSTSQVVDILRYVMTGQVGQ